MSTYFQPYEGKRPYVFISYAHRDSERVLTLLNELNARKLRLWYDEGIPAGSDWPKNIELHMRNSASVLFFLSESAMASANCYSEIQTAHNLSKPIGIVRLDDAVPDSRWKALLESAPVLGAAPEPQAEDVQSWKLLKRKYYRRWSDNLRTDVIGLAVSLFLLLGVAAGLIALINSEPERSSPDAAAPPPTTETTAKAPEETVPEPTVDPGLFPVVFPDAQQERAVRLILQKSEGDVLRPDLADVKGLYLCGNMVLEDPEDITADADGTVRVSGAPVVTGIVSDLSLIGQMVFLEKLALVDQPLDDLSPLNGLVLLTELDLRSSTVSDLSVLADLPSLTVLHLEHTAVSDLSALESLPSLKTVTVSADMLPLSFTEDKPFRVILIP